MRSAEVLLHAAGDQAPDNDDAPTVAPLHRGHRRGGRIPRHHLVVLAVIGVAGLTRGMYWAAVSPVFNPIDEHAHYAYVESMATSFRPPVVGRDHLSPEALDLVKRTQTAEWRSAAVPPDPADPRWGLLRDSYEGVQGPAYYALMAVPFRLVHGFGTLSTLYALRIATLLLALTAVPVAYLLARELFPRRPDAWLAAPALLVVLQGFNGNLSSLSNDALVVPLAGVTLLVVARARRSGLTVVHGLAAGALVGLGFSTKSQMVALVPIVAVGALAIARVRRDRVALVVRWVAAAGAAAAVVAGPWLWWNLATYGTFSASDEVDKITGPLQPNHPFTYAGIREHVVSGTTGFWDYQLAARTLGRYMWVWSIAGLGLLLAAVVVSLVRRRRTEAAALAWSGSTFFVTLGMMLVVIYGVFGGRSSVVGRHLYPSLVAVVVVIAVAAFVVAGRVAGWLLLFVLCNLALTFEQPLVTSLVDRAYAEGLIGDLSPVVDQSWGVRLVAATAVEVDAPCPAHKFALAFSGSTAPDRLTVVTPSGRSVVARSEQQGSAAQYLTVFDLPAPTERFTVEVGGAALSASDDERDPHLALAGEPGDPVARVFCQVADPERARFDQRFGPDHPAGIRHGQVLAWPVAWAWSARLALLAGAGAMLVARRRAGRAPAPPTGAG